jgi:hypothetical protein
MFRGLYHRAGAVKLGGWPTQSVKEPEREVFVTAWTDLLCVVRKLHVWLAPVREACC